MLQYINIFLELISTNWPQLKSCGYQYVTSIFPRDLMIAATNFVALRHYETSLGTLFPLPFAPYPYPFVPLSLFNIDYRNRCG